MSDISDCSDCVAWWCSGYGIRLAIERPQIWLSAVPPPGNNGHVAHTSASVTKQYNLVPA